MLTRVLRRPSGLDADLVQSGQAGKPQAEASGIRPQKTTSRSSRKMLGQLVLSMGSSTKLLRSSTNLRLEALRLVVVFARHLGGVVTVLADPVLED